jgi:twitching motility protein PilT
MREDPNIIMIWEMRDPETVKAALDLAETWHLIISTLHTSGSAQTITRLVNFFPLEHQANIRTKIAENLAGVLSQRLIHRSGDNWRIWIFELMIANTPIKNLIRLWDLNQIHSIIETWSKEWMITMENHAKLLESKWLIEKKDYINYFIEK